MATVVVTFFLFARFYVCNMDADYQERPRDHNISSRRNRWSMNSQRLEQIVAKLMKPISDIRSSFNTDHCALLEEYLTEAGLHALDASEEDGDAADSVAPNYPELALLLQHSVSLYSRKVDFLYQHVLNISESLNNSTLEEEGAEAAGEVGEAGDAGETASPRRRRPASVAEPFAHIELDVSSSARRESSAPRPPPTLPRMYIELEPRVLADSDAPLLDYAGEPVGLPADFHVTWRLQDGLLVDELAGPGAASEPALKPVSLVELQAALEAAAPAWPALRGELCSRSPSPERLDEPVPLHASTPLPDSALSPLRRDRKRRSNVNTDDIAVGSINIEISRELRRKLKKIKEFNLNARWITSVVERRKSRILVERRRLRERQLLPPDSEFRGFDLPETDIGGFLGWSSTEAALALRAARLSLRPEHESDDDGFFEQSSLADSDHSRAEELAGGAGCAGGAGGAGRPLCVESLARAVLAALPAAGAVPFGALLAATAQDHADVSRTLLTTLFLANAGNVEIVRGAPLAVGAFSVRLLSADARLYRAAARDHARPDPHPAPRTPPHTPPPPRPP